MRLVPELLRVRSPVANIFFQKEKVVKSGFGRRLVFKRSWLQIPTPDTGWTFFTLVCCKNFTVCLKRPKNEKEAGNGHLKKVVMR